MTTSADSNLRGSLLRLPPTINHSSAIMHQYFSTFGYYDDNQIRRKHKQATSSFPDSLATTSAHLPNKGSKAYSGMVIMFCVTRLTFMN